MRTSPHKTDQSVVSVRQLPPVTSRPSEPGRWEVSYGSEAVGWRVIGWIEERFLGRAHTRFYFAIGIHPESGKRYRLEGDPRFDNQVNTVADFHLDPMTSRQHLWMAMSD